MVLDHQRDIKHNLFIEIKNYFKKVKVVQDPVIILLIILVSYYLKMQLSK